MLTQRSVLLSTLKRRQMRADWCFGGKSCALKGRKNIKNNSKQWKEKEKKKTSRVSTKEIAREDAAPSHVPFFRVAHSFITTSARQKRCLLHGSGYAKGWVYYKEQRKTSVLRKTLPDSSLKIKKKKEQKKSSRSRLSMQQQQRLKEKKRSSMSSVHIVRVRVTPSHRTCSSVLTNQTPAHVHRLYQFTFVQVWYPNKEKNKSMKALNDNNSSKRTLHSKHRW